MLLTNTSLMPVHRRSHPLVLGALLLTISALCMTGCGGAKPADDAGGAAKAPAGAAVGGAAMAPDAGAAKDQALIKETAGEKNPEAGAGGGK